MVGREFHWVISASKIDLQGLSMSNSRENAKAHREPESLRLLGLLASRTESNPCCRREREAIYGDAGDACESASTRHEKNTKKITRPIY